MGEDRKRWRETDEGEMKSEEKSEKQKQKGTKEIVQQRTSKGNVPIKL